MSPEQPDRALLERILADPQFVRAEDPTDFWTQLTGWLRDWLASFLQTSGMRGFASGTRFVVLAAAVLAAAWGLYRWLHRRRRSAPLTSDAEPAPTTRLELDSPAQHLARARALLGSDTRGAIREALLGLLSALERERLAQPDRVKTNRELAQELVARGAPVSISESAHRLLAWYDAAFYSLNPVQSGDAARFLDEVSGLQQTLASAR